MYSTSRIGAAIPEYIILSIKGEVMDQPNPPLYLFHANTSYILETNTSLRRSAELNKDQTSTSHVTLQDSPPIRIVTESRLDLETDQRSTTCSVSVFQNFMQLLIKKIEDNMFGFGVGGEMENISRPMQ